MLHKLRNHLAEQFSQQWIGVVSVLIATTALLTSNYRSEQIEENRNIRWACFEVLRELSALQLVIDQAYYGQDNVRGDAITGWGHVLLIDDFSALMPEPMPSHSQALKATWHLEFQALDSSEEANQKISQAIAENRMAVLQVLQQLE